MGISAHRRLERQQVGPSCWVVVVTFAALCQHALYAQEPEVAVATDAGFRLFEPLDSQNNSASAAENARNSANARATRNTQASPTFTLVGTSKIGNKQSALLKHLNGEVVRIPLSGNGVIPIPGYDLYAVLRYEAGELAIRYPTTTPCGDFPEQGVSCDSTTNIASLRLTTAEPIVVSAPAVAPVEDTAQEAEDSDTEADAAPGNPFAAIRDRARAANANQTNQNSSGFQPRRIDPADVPPGYRVVSTPFGDRLVEQQ